MCGHWVGSPPEIGITDLLRDVPPTERRHYHDFHQYYAIIEGSVVIDVEGEQLTVNASQVLMVEPGEQHEVVAVNPETGVRWVIIKEQSRLDGKHLVD